MKLAPCLFMLCLAFTATAQHNPDHLDEIARTYLTQHATQWGLTADDIAELRLTDQYTSRHNGVAHLYYLQQFQGIDVKRATYQVHIQDSEVLFATQKLLPDLRAKISGSSLALSADEAVRKSFESVGHPINGSLTVARRNADQTVVFAKGEHALIDMTARPAYVTDHQGMLRLTWDVVIEPAKGLDLWNVMVDARTGRVVAKENRTLYCSFPDHFLQRQHTCAEYTLPTPPPPVVGTQSDGSRYNVIPVPFESPRHGERMLLEDPSDTAASPFGWLDTDGVDGPDETITKGNNVHAFIDRDGDFSPNEPATNGGDTLNFDFPFDQTKEPVDYQDASVTNLFYMNNIMHDFAWHYGMDEAAGNFQLNNYTGQGADGDHVLAHSQFNAADTVEPSLNNATFGTPSDGGSGRMRMFVWEGAGANQLLRVESPADVAGTYATATTASDWGGAITAVPLTAEVAIVQDATGNATQGCNELINPEEIEGKIALIDRGTCQFGLKALNAQNAGAVGFIICNFEEGLVTMGAGSVGDQVTIPGVFIANSDCQKIRVFVESGLTVSFVNESAGMGPNRRDASFDNGIVAHEFGHGISNRLTGGPNASGCLHLYDTDNNGSSDDGEQMGEGWSDFFTLVTSVHEGDDGATPRGIATYSAGQEITGGGIRPFPYTTNMSVNPMTYDDIAFYSIPHGVGTVWCTMLWDMYWAFVDAYGFDPDLYTGTGGNNMAVQLVMDGMKMQTCEPGFVDGRDAILAADRALYGGANQQLIWEAFARRGLGYSADQGEDRFRRDGSEAFDIDPRVIKELKVVKHMSPFIEPGDPITVNLMAVNHRDEDATQVVVTDAIPDGTTYINGSASMASDLSGNAIAFDVDTIGAGDTVLISYQVQSSANLFSESIFMDDMENGLDNWDLIITEDPINYVIWSLQPYIVNGGSSAWMAENIDTNTDQSIITLDEFLISGDQPLLVFYQNVDVEKFFDAGILQISDDGGLTWTAVPEDKLVRGRYLAQVQFSLFAIPNIRAWTGNSGGWHPIVVDLSEYAGEEIKLRFRFASDGNTNSIGWAMDDLEIMNAFNYNSEACITSAEGDGTCTMAVERGTIVASSEVSSARDVLPSGLELRAFPNPAGDFLNLNVNTTTPETVTLRVMSQTGQVLWSRESMVHGAYSVQVNTREFADGMYIVQVTSSQGQLVRKVVIQ